ncbi:MAG: hypothetical protein LBQ28_04395 [Prevotellaceae bacterium]|jgi:hypothetical protein|nr:hypothetical protein [Prevotellaceae bacterium]
MERYKKLPGFFNVSVPRQMLRSYSILCGYSYIDIAGYGEFPIQGIVIICIMRNNIGKFGLTEDNYNNTFISNVLPNLEEYAKGFLDGYNTIFEPFINTIEAKKEMVLNAALKADMPFGEKHLSNGEIEYFLYEGGKYEGERYKAWEIILQTPNEFIKYFSTVENTDNAQPQQTTIPDTILNELQKQGFIAQNHLTWIGQKNLCAYFVDRYFENKTNKWAIGESLFHVKYLAQLKDIYMNSKTGYPKGYKNIDNILNKQK